MAKLSISEASRVAGVARSTLHRAIKQGRISLDPDGHLDTAELLRLGYTLQGVAQQSHATVRQDATHQYPVAQQVPSRASPLVMEALQRERDLLQQQLDATRELLQSEREAALERERATRDREALLLQMLHEAQQRYDRLLEAPRPAPVPPAVPVAPERNTVDVHPVTTLAAIPPAWQRVIDYVRSVNRAVTPAEIQQALGLAQTPRHMLNRMVHRGVLQRVAPGVFGLEG